MFIIMREGVRTQIVDIQALLMADDKLRWHLRRKRKFDQYGYLGQI